uniref:SEA domain-containing protein n=1 Tax=Clastoptera arizonana TaxID=38151 RepID=A0A1B6CE74_9HEMI
MDNPAFQIDIDARVKKKPLVRANSVLMPTNKSWSLTQGRGLKLCRCNSLLVPKKCCADSDKDFSTTRHFFTRINNTQIQSPVYSKWADSFTSIRKSDGNFKICKNEQSKTKVISTIYEPQFLTSDKNYSGWDKSKHIGDTNNKTLKKEWFPGGWQAHFANSQYLSPSQKFMTLLCALLLTLLILGNIVYILQTVKTSTTGSNDYNQNSTWFDVVLINGEFRITNEHYQPSLSNNTSEEFQILGGHISKQLDNLFRVSAISEPYHSTMVTHFEPDLIIHLQMVLKTSYDISSSKVGMTFLRGLHHHNNHVWLGNFSVDIQSIGFLATSDGIAWTPWSDWSECIFTEDVGYIHKRTRNCTLRSKRYLFSTLPCLLIPHSHGDIESVPCKQQEVVDVDDKNTIMNKESLINVQNITEQIKESVFYKTVTGRSIKDISMNQSANILVKGNENYSTLEPLNVNKSNKDDLTTHYTPTTESAMNNIISIMDHENYNSVKANRTKTSCNCGLEEVCVALVNELIPHCLKMLDHKDPTGCGGHCKLNVQICHQIKGNFYRCLDDSKCLSDEWKCGNQLCIPQEKRCDGHFNCYDHTDELGCDCLGTEQFTCNDSQCIPNYRFCDGFPDCSDQSDEPFGCSGECKRHEWKCSNSRCISKTTLCNGVDDCGDESDEANCPQKENQ